MVGYENLYLLRPELSDTDIKKVRTLVEKIVKAHDGEVVAWDDWGKRRLAFPIQKESRGRYAYVVFTGNNKLVTELERNFRISDQVMRFVTVKLSDEFDSAGFKKSFVGKSLLEKQAKPEAAPES